ncbi:MAG: aldo/keto reductase [Actinomycetota bacterium]|nr:aldo/keto reductase [Actinomycetota bacterium]
MRTQRLGAKGPELSVVGFGAWEAGGDAWGPNRSETAVIDAIGAGIEAGMNWVDTAEVYGNGVSEMLVGKALAGRQDGTLLATKVAPAPEGTGFRPEQVRAACDASLVRLGIDVIDLYQLHWPDATGVPIEDTWAAMSGLVDAGKVRWVGVSNFDQSLIERCRAGRPVDSLQQEFSLVHLDDGELIRWCGEAGIGVLSYSPLGAGLLTGALRREDAEQIDDWRASDGLTSGTHLDRTFALVDGMRPLAERLGVSVPQLALAWNWQQPGVTSAIAGSRDAEHTRSNAAAGDLELDERTLAELEALIEPRGTGRH